MTTRRDQVLVVDDDVVFLKQAEELLGERYQVSLAKSPGQAFCLLESGFVPDVILLDVGMPEMDGYEMLGKLQQMESLVDVPVIFLTGMTGQSAEVRGLEAGAVDYITKPFHREVLFARLQRHLEIGRRERQLRQENREGAGVWLDTAKLEAMAKLLSATETKIARRIALGYSNKEIADDLSYSYAYVKKVAGVIFEKVGVSKRSELRRLLTL